MPYQRYLEYTTNLWINQLYLMQVLSEKFVSLVRSSSSLAANISDKIYK